MATAKIKSVLSEHKKIICLVLVLVLATAVMLHFFLKDTTEADEGVTIPDTAATTTSNGQEALRIIAANLQYKENMYIDYAVIKNPAFDSVKASDIKMLFWTDYVNAENSFTLENKNNRYEKSLYAEQDIKVSGTSYDAALFVSDGIAPKQIGDVIYARAYVEYDGKTYYSNVVRYSVLDYVYARRDMVDVSTSKGQAQLNLYNYILEYGASAQVTLGYRTNRLVTSHGAKISVKNGTFADGCNSGVFLSGDKVTIYADQISDKYGKFLYWQDGAGNKIDGAGNVHDITVNNETANTTYTAVCSGTYAATITGGTVTLNGNEANSQSLAVGADYTLVPGTAPAGKIFDYWTVNGDKIGGNTLTFDTKDETVTVEAIYRDPVGATFDEDDLKVGDLVPQQNYTSGDNTFYLEGKEEVEDISARIEDGKLVLTDANDKKGGGVIFKVAQTSGKFTVVELTMSISECTGSVPLQIQLGGYMLQLECINDTFKIYDSNGKKAGYLEKTFKKGDEVSLKMIVTTDGDNRAYVFLGDDCIAKSYNVGDTINDTVTVHALADSTLTVSLDSLRAYRCDLTAEQEADFDPTNTYVTPNTNSSATDMELMFGEKVAAAFATMDAELFTPDVYEWMASLYDPETGAFYFSVSGRENYGYLTDIETTAQMSGLINTLFGTGYAGALTTEQQAKMVSWVQTLMSNRDGYNYHPQWGVNIGDSRRSRDYTYASTPYNALGVTGTRLYNDANYRLSGGKQGIAGKIDPITYNFTTTDSGVSAVAYSFGLTSPLGRSAASAVSRVVLSSSVVATAAGIDMPAQLASEEAFINYVNARWNSTCEKNRADNKSSGGILHERHLCTAECDKTVKTVDGATRMVLENGKVVFRQNEKCENPEIHECMHDVGHSYGFASVIGTQVSQIKAAGLTKLHVDYYLDLQEQVQRSLRAQDKKENGLWEEEITYDTISGLLKACGTPGSDEVMFPYAFEAMSSALECALYSVEDYDSKNESIVSIYNPFNAIKGIMNNLNSYGGEEGKAIIAEFREVMAKTITDEEKIAKGEDLVTVTAGKLELFKMPDGGYSYSQDGSSTTSQGQPVAIAGSREGDVNGTALVFGTRSALLACFGIAEGAVYTGTNATINDEKLACDLNGNGAIDEDEKNITHLQRFQYLLATKGAIVKVDTDSNANVVVHDFNDKEIGTVIGAGTVVEHNGEKAIFLQDTSSTSGQGIVFDGGKTYSDEEKVTLALRMKVTKPSGSTTHQIFIQNTAGTNMLRIDCTYANGKFTFDNDDADGKTNASLFGNVTATEWFTVNIEFYPNGYEKDGKTVYGTFSVTQNNVTQTADLTVVLGGKGQAGRVYLYTLYGAVTDTLYDNIKLTQHLNPTMDGQKGMYHFDTKTQKFLFPENVEKNPTNKDDNVYLINSNAGFAAYNYLATSVAYNFNYAQLDLFLRDVKDGERVDLKLVDNSGAVITGIYLEKNGQNVTFYAVNGLTILNLVVDTQQWMTVKIEYNYDMLNPQLDVVVRYANAENNNYYETTAAYLTDVEVYGAANPYSFATLAVSGSGVYVDDLFVRNVCVSFGDHEHVYIEKATNGYSAGTDEKGHNVYNKSCKHCGAASADTFVVHIYEDRPDSKYIVEEASYEKAALYVESCTLCDAEGTKTFRYGPTAYDNDCHNFDKIGSLPGYAKIEGDVTAESGYFYKEETLFEKTNYYLNLKKQNKASGTLILALKYNLKAGEELANAERYVYSFDLRWGGASEHVPEIIYVKILDNGTELPATATGIFKASDDGEYATYGGVVFNKREWHNIKYEFVRNGEGDEWTLKTYIDGEEVKSVSLEIKGLPNVKVELRYPQTVEGVQKVNNVSVDFDRLKAIAEFKTPEASDGNVDSGESGETVEPDEGV